MKTTFLCLYFLPTLELKCFDNSFQTDQLKRHGNYGINLLQLEIELVGKIEKTTWIIYFLKSACQNKTK